MLLGKTEVIVSACDGEYEHEYSWYGPIERTEFSLQVEAALFAASKKAKNVSVIIRPKYNEEDEKGRFFREWRSFNGNDFRECRWDF